MGKSGLVIAVACLAGVGTLSLALSGADGGGSADGLFSVPRAMAQTAPAVLPRPQWAASATGRIEPKDGEIHVVTQAAGRIETVLVKANEKVAKGDLMIVLDDDEQMERMKYAEAEAQVRKGERDEEEAKGLARDRRQAEDALADAERDVFAARLAVDDAVLAARTGGTDGEAAAQARNRLSEAIAAAAEKRDALAKVLANPDMPLPSRLESSVTQARAELAMAEIAVDRTRIRAPFDGTVLSVQAKEGETAMPSAEYPLLSMGNLSTLRVRAEVEERDVSKIRLGQRVVVRADAFPQRDFEGTVTSIAGALGAPRIAARGPRRPNDVEVLEVLATLDGAPPLLPGMRVDVFFKLDATAQSDSG